MDWWDTSRIIREHNLGKPGFVSSVIFVAFSQWAKSTMTGESMKGKWWGRNQFDGSTSRVVGFQNYPDGGCLKSGIPKSPWVSIPKWSNIGWLGGTGTSFFFGNWWYSINNWVIIICLLSIIQMDITRVITTYNHHRWCFCCPCT